jgi:hypothetical protein
MHVYLFTSEADHSIKLVEQELRKRSISYDLYGFKTVSIRPTGMFVCGKKLIVKKSDRIFMRSPFNAPYYTRDYAAIARHMVQEYYDSIVFDREVYIKHLPYYEDKLYQALLYDRLSVPTPRIWYFSEKRQIVWETLVYPIVLKKRISSRSRGNYLITSKNELEERIRSIRLHDYLLQEYIEAESDIRLNVLKGKVLYAMKRNMHVREHNRLAVQGVVPLKKPPSELVSYALTITKAMGADFAGIDFLKSKKGRYFVIESNLSPQFHRAGDIMPIKTAQLLVDAIVTYSPH